MYEGMRVNIDHVDPGQRRSLRDRIGIVKNIAVKEDGLYGDFYFNPKHALAEQVAWDAEKATSTGGASISRCSAQIEQLTKLISQANPFEIVTRG